MPRLLDGRTRWHRIRGPVAVATALGALAVALHLRDPHRSTWVVCPWQALTGTDCPGCGGLRAVNDLTNLRIGDAASSNLLFVAALPATAFVLARWVNDAWTGVRRVANPRRAATLSIGAGVVLVAWWVIRNLPGLEWLRT